MLKKKPHLVCKTSPLTLLRGFKVSVAAPKWSKIQVQIRQYFNVIIHSCHKNMCDPAGLHLRLGRDGSKGADETHNGRSGMLQVGRKHVLLQTHTALRRNGKS